MSKTLTKSTLDSIWAEIIKARAGYKSEYSGKLGKKAGGDEILHSHHLCGKPNLRLRYEFDNGICLTAGEHKFIAHHQGRQEQFRMRVKQIRGEDIFQRLERLSHQATKQNLQVIKMYLDQELERLKNNKRGIEL